MGNRVNRKENRLLDTPEFAIRTLSGYNKGRETRTAIRCQWFALRSQEPAGIGVLAGTPLFMLATFLLLDVI